MCRIKFDTSYYYMASIQRFSSDKNETAEKEYHAKLSLCPLLLWYRGYHPCNLGFSCSKKHLVGVRAMSTFFGGKFFLFPWLVSRNSCTKNPMIGGVVCIYCVEHLAQPECAESGDNYTATKEDLPQCCWSFSRVSNDSRQLLVATNGGLNNPLATTSTISIQS